MEKKIILSQADKKALDKEMAKIPDICNEIQCGSIECAKCPVHPIVELLSKADALAEELINYSD